MAKKNFIRIIQAGLLGIVVAVTLPACSDDHFDVKDGGGDGSNATLTLWEQIEQRPELKNFADVVKKTPYFKDEAHPSKEYTFDKVLSGTQVFTVFAPTNDAFTTEERDEMLALLETEPYDVFLRLVGNQIALNRYNATGTGVEKLVTINSKRATFDRANATFQNIALKSKNIAATNGTLHTMDTKAPFAYNIYEYIKANGNLYGELKKWITEHDTIYFNASASVEGGSDRDGNPTYVDSVYYRTNTLFTGFSDYEPSSIEWVLKHKIFKADLEAEDSVWAMILPTDDAWRAAKARIESYYTYAPEYINKYREDSGNDGETIGVNNADSLKELAIRMDLASTLVFNARLQLRDEDQKGFWTAETFNDAPFAKMFTTRADTFTIAGQDNIKNILFEGNTNPIKASNGILYPVNNWRFDEVDNIYDLDIKVNNNSIFKFEEMGPTIAEQKTFNSTNTLAQLLGTVYKEYFYYISNGTSAPKIQFKLIDTERNHQVMSGIDYEIGFVMVPDFYRSTTDTTGISDLVIPKNRIECQITYNNGTFKNTNNGKADKGTSSKYRFDYDGLKVDTVWLADDDGARVSMRFDYSYKNMTKSYPTIELTSKASAGDVNKGLYSHAFSIDRIILRAKRTDE